MLLKTALTAVYLLLVEIPPQLFELVATGLQWQTGFWNAKLELCFY